MRFSSRFLKFLHVCLMKPPFPEGCRRLFSVFRWSDSGVFSYFHHSVRRLVEPCRWSLNAFLNCTHQDVRDSGDSQPSQTYDSWICRFLPANWRWGVPAAHPDRPGEDPEHKAWPGSQDLQLHPDVQDHWEVRLQGTLTSTDLRTANAGLWLLPSDEAGSPRLRAWWSDVFTMMMMMMMNVLMKHYKAHQPCSPDAGVL